MNAVPFDPTMLREWSLVTAPFFAWVVGFVIAWAGAVIVRRQDPQEVRRDMTDSPLWKWSFLATVLWLFGGVILTSMAG